MLAVNGSLSCPLASGRWETHEEGKGATGWVMTRMIPHSGTDTLDIKVSWQSPTGMRFSARWSDFMTGARQLVAGCLAQEDIFDRGKDPLLKNESHPACVELGKHPEQAKDGS